MADVRDALGAYRVVTLFGPGGIGKTRVAHELAQTMNKAFPSGVWHADLTNLATREEQFLTVAAAVGVRNWSQRPAIELIIEQIGAAHGLLVLDNCEHLIEGVRELVNTLISSTPNVCVLATSREVLKLPAERVLAVPALSLPTGVDDASDHSAYQLLVDRAAAVDFEITDTYHAVQLCQRLEGLPLAIELAAARLRTMTLADFLDLLDEHGLGVLAGRRDPAAPHHETLVTTIEVSYNLCSRLQRTLWRRLTVFEGTFTARAAAAVCADEVIGSFQVYELLAELVDQSVVESDNTGRTARYRLKDSIREYGRSWLNDYSGELDATIVAHRDYYSQLVVTASQQWLGPDEIVWMEQIRLDGPDLRAMIDRCLAEPGLVETGVMAALAWASTREPFFNGRVREIRRYVFSCLELLPATASALRATTLAMAVWICVNQGDQHNATRRLTECRDQVRQLGNPRLPFVFFAEGAHAMLVDGTKNSLDLLTEARDLLAGAGDHPAEHMAQMLLAMDASFNGSIEQARRESERHMRAANRCGAPWAIAWAEWTMANAARQRGELQAALERFRAAMRAQSRVADWWGTTWSAHGVGWTLAALNALSEATDVLGATEVMRVVAGSDIDGMAPFRAAQRAAVSLCRAALGEHDFEHRYRAAASVPYQQAVSIVLDAVATALGESVGAESEPVPMHPDLARLSTTEREIAALIAEGMTNTQIAARRIRSTRTIQTQIRSIMDKWGVTTRALIAVRYDQLKRGHAADDGPTFANGRGRTTG